MTTDFITNFAVGLMFALAFLGAMWLASFLGDSVVEWRNANRKINTDVPELKDSVRELETRLSLVESRLGRLRTARDHESAGGPVNGASREDGRQLAAG